MNVLAKILIPRITASIHYILSELEEMEREEIFRLKRVKQNKLKNASHVEEVGGGEKTQITDEPLPKNMQQQVTKETEGEIESVGETAPLKSAAEGDPIVEMKLPESGQTEDDLMLLEHIETMKNVDEIIKTLKEEKEDGLEQLDGEISELPEEESNTKQLSDVDGLDKGLKEVEKKDLERPIEEKFKMSEETPDTGLLDLLKRPSVLPMPPKPDDQGSDMEKEDELAEVVSKTSEFSLDAPFDQKYEIVEESMILETPLDQAHEAAEDATTFETSLDQANEIVEDATIPETPLDHAPETAEDTTTSETSLDQASKIAVDTTFPEAPLDQTHKTSGDTMTPETSLDQVYKTGEDTTISETPLDQTHETTENTMIPETLAEETTITETPLDQTLSKEYEVAEVIPDAAEEQEEHFGESFDKENITPSDKDKSSITSKESDKIRKSSREQLHKEELPAEIPEPSSLETMTPSDFSSNVEVGESKSGAVIKSSHISEKDIIEMTAQSDVIKPKPSVRIQLPIDSEQSVERVISKTSIENVSIVETEVSLDRSAEGDSPMGTGTGGRGPTKIDRTIHEGSVQGISDVDPYFNADAVPVEVFEDIDLGTEYSRSEPTIEGGKDSEDQQTTGIEKEHLEVTKASASKPQNEVDLPKAQLLDNKNSLTDRSNEDFSDRKDDNYEADVELDETDVDVSTSREPHSKDARKDKKENKQDSDADKQS